LTASCQAVGINKREMLEDYYLDELLLVLDAYADMHKSDKDRDEEYREVYADELD